MSEGMVFCHGCGKQIHSTARMCPHCGAPQGRQSASTSNSVGIGLKEAISICFSKYATFEGRASRGEFWYFYLANILLNIAFSILTGIFGSAIFTIASVLWSLAVLIPNLAVAVRRMHDINKSGWYILIGLLSIPLYFVMATAFIYAGAYSSVAAGIFGFVALLAALAVVIWQIVLYATRGTQGPNRYGQDPLV